jgi:hypothetical protein
MNEHFSKPKERLNIREVANSSSEVSMQGLSEPEGNVSLDKAPGTHGSPIAGTTGGICTVYRAYHLGFGLCHQPHLGGVSLSYPA